MGCLDGRGGNSAVVSDGVGIRLEAKLFSND